jgi:ammonium transporter, Amt family
MTVDTFWLLGCAAFVFLMQPGFMCLESGLTRTKNSINVAVKNLTDFGISAILFWAVGYGLAFGTSADGWIGSENFFLNPESTAPEITAFFIFEMMFCSTASTIVSGAAAERLKFIAYVVTTIIISGLIYPMFTHWAWNGLNSGEFSGYLGQRGFVDFAGATVVHSVGGWVSLAVLLVIGPRTGRFAKFGKSHKIHKIHGSNLPFSVLGAMLMWIGWLGFNGGSLLAFNDQIPLVLLNTLLAGASGMVTAGLVSWQRLKTYKVEVLINGSLAGLVSITAACNVVITPVALIIGSVGGAVSILISYYLQHWQIDDAVDAIPVHLGGGVWGTLAVGLYGQLDLLGTGLSRGGQLLVQLEGIVVCGIWAFGLTWILLHLINRFMPLRVSLKEEEQGLNVSEHNAKNLVYEMLEVMNVQATTQDLSLRVPVEPFTEIGYIANHYNRVIDSLEASTLELKQFNADLEQTVQQRTEEVLKAKEKAEVANRAKSTFITNMSHELRTPLNAILGFAQLMTRSQTLPLEQQEHLNIISRSGEHLLSLINNILDLSKIEAEQITLNESNFDLYCFLDDLEQMFELKAKNKGLQLSLEIQAQVPQYIKTDESKLRQILINLLNNALKFTDKGEVIIRVFAQGVGDSQIDSFVDAKLIFEVEDTGKGIADHELNSLFEAFVQTKTGRNAKEGTGLGLSISRKFVQLMGGDITVQSEVDQGSVFQFDLAVQKIAANEIILVEPTQTIVGLQAEQPQYRILVVDDQLDNRRLLVKLLQPLGFEVREGQNGEEAISQWQDWQPHLILMDIRMPVMDGYQAIKQIKSNCSSQPTTTKIVAITASAMEEDRAVILATGCDDFMRKPFQATELFETVTKHLGVCYTYAESNHQEKSEKFLLKQLDSNALSVLSDELLIALRQSIMAIDLEQISKIIEQIAQENKQLAKIINRHIDNFEYEHILRVLPK